MLYRALLAAAGQGSVVTPLALTRLATSSTTGSSETLSTSGTLGTSTDAHWVFIGISTTTTGGTATFPTQVRLAGVDCTQVASLGTGATAVSIYVTNSQLTVTSGSISLQWVGNAQDAKSFCCWEALDIVSTTALDTFTTSDAAHTAPALTTTPGGFILAQSFHEGGTSVAVDSDGLFTSSVGVANGNLRASGVAHTVGPGTTTGNVRLGYSGSPTDTAIVYASFGDT